MSEHTYNGNPAYYRALDRSVLVVAIVGHSGSDWAAWIGSVPGKNHDHEWVSVAMNGTKIPEWMAAKLFPNLNETYEWRA